MKEFTWKLTTVVNSKCYAHILDKVHWHDIQQVIIGTRAVHIKTINNIVKTKFHHIHDYEMYKVPLETLEEIYLTNFSDT
jgi:hypothetical protein